MKRRRLGELEGGAQAQASPLEKLRFRAAPEAVGVSDVRLAAPDPSVSGDRPRLRTAHAVRRDRQGAAEPIAIGDHAAPICTNLSAETGSEL